MDIVDAESFSGVGAVAGVTEAFHLTAGVTLGEDAIGYSGVRFYPTRS